MYVPAHFKIDDANTMYDLIEQHSFAAVISNHNGAPYATHIPLTLDRAKGELYGHFARANPHWHDIGGQEVLAIFQGPHCYISPSWYETGKSVPTWNYISVHVYGRIEFVDDADLLRSLRTMVSKYENADTPYSMDEASDYIESLSKGVVGFKLPISRMEGKQKLSQNHSVERQRRVIEQLQQLADPDAREIAGLMLRNLPKA